MSSSKKTTANPVPKEPEPGELGGRTETPEQQKKVKKAKKDRKTPSNEPTTVVDPANQTRTKVPNNPQGGNDTSAEGTQSADLQNLQSSTQQGTHTEEEELVNYENTEDEAGVTHYEDEGIFAVPEGSNETLEPEAELGEGTLENLDLGESQRKVLVKERNNELLATMSDDTIILRDYSETEKAQLMSDYPLEYWFLDPELPVRNARVVFDGTWLGILPEHKQDAVLRAFGARIITPEQPDLLDEQTQIEDWKMVSILATAIAEKANSRLEDLQPDVENMEFCPYAWKETSGERMAHVVKSMVDWEENSSQDLGTKLFGHELIRPTNLHEMYYNDKDCGCMACKGARIIKNKFPRSNNPQTSLSVCSSQARHEGPKEILGGKPALKAGPSNRPTTEKPRAPTIQLTRDGQVKNLGNPLPKHTIGRKDEIKWRAGVEKELEPKGLAKDDGRRNDRSMSDNRSIQQTIRTSGSSMKPALPVNNKYEMTDEEIDEAVNPSRQHEPTPSSTHMSIDNNEKKGNLKRGRVETSDEEDDNRSITSEKRTKRNYIEKHPYIMKDLNIGAISELESHWNERKALGSFISPVDNFTEDALDTIKIGWGNELSELFSRDPKEIIRLLREMLGVKISADDYIQELQKMRINFGDFDHLNIVTFVKDATKIIREITNRKNEVKDFKRMTKVTIRGWLNGLGKSTTTANDNLHYAMEQLDWADDTFEEFLRDLWKEAQKIATEADKWRRKNESSSPPRRERTSERRQQFRDDSSHRSTSPARSYQSSSKEKNKPPAKKAKTEQQEKKLCYKCGSDTHATENCVLGPLHPDVNHSTTVPFLDSSVGKHYSKLGKKKLDFEYKLNPADDALVQDKKLKDKIHLALQEKQKKDKATRKGEEFTICSLLESNTNPNHDPKTLLFSSVIAQDNSEMNIASLVDPGALGCSLINRRLATNLLLKGNKYHSCNISLSSPLEENKKVLSHNFIECKFKFKNEQTNEFETLPLKALIVDMKIDLIIAKAYYKKHKLHDKLRSIFIDDETKDGEANEDEIIAEQNRTYHDVLVSHLEQRVGELSLKSEINQPIQEIVKNNLDWFGKKSEEDSEFAPTDSSLYLGSGGKEISLSEEQEQILGLISFSGSSQFQGRMKNLVRRKARIFSKILNKKAAKIEPMPIKVDEEKWKCNQSKAGPRLLSPEKSKELRKQIDELESIGVIRKSTSMYHSQVLLVIKPDGSWRFCVDFRFLNSCMEMLGWPLPNIDEIVTRIGNASPRYMGKMDFTKGFYQGEIEEKCRWLTAFITPFGMYEWNRIAMGLAIAPAWFQRQIAETVLRELVSSVVEHYIDDLLIYAQTEEEFLRKMEVLFNRLEEHNIYLNPAKCSFGCEKIDFLGFEFDQQGRRMQPKKIDKIMNYPKPRLAGQLKSFLGMANYFHEFIERIAEVQRPLVQMVAGYTKAKRKDVLIWTPEAEEAFEKIRNAVNNCPQLHFLREDRELILQTDASDYGIGGVLFQKEKNKNTNTNEKENPNKNKIYPVGFFSKALSNHALHWSTIEKEGYAIIASVKHWEHLLSGRTFRLETDHKNLQYISESCSNKVIRWKLALQEFQFTTTYIKGQTNEIADFLSRIPPEHELLERKEEAKEEHYVCSLIATDERDEENEYMRVDPAEDYCTLIATLLEDYNYTNEQRKMIGKVHNSTVGHFGIHKTVNTLKEQGNDWPHMRGHVRKFIRNCPICQKLSEESTLSAVNPYTTSTRDPMECLNIDYIGPFKFEQGDKYILVVIDCFSRFVNLFATDTNSALETAKCLMKHFGIFGTPIAIRSDRGSHFTADLMQELMGLCGIYHEKSIAYSKEENSIVERANKEVGRHLRAIFLDGRIAEAMEEDLPIVQRIMNNSIHSSIGERPARILFGGSIDLDKQILYDAELPSPGKYSLKEFTKKLFERQKALLELAKKHQDDIDVKNTSKRLQDQENIDPTKRTDEFSFPVGSFVLAEYETGLNGGRRPPNKTLAPKEGPFRVVKKEHPVYDLEHLATGKKRTCHISLLSPFLYEPEHTDPEEIAFNEAQLVPVSNVIAHRNNSGNDRINNYEFLIHWLNRNERFDEWLPWWKVRENEKVHEYMAQNGLQNKIPAKFQGAEGNKLKKKKTVHFADDVQIGSEGSK
jgi:hypothetical protein